MKYKIKLEKSNIIFMSSVIVLSLISCVFWVILKKYVYFIIYFILTSIIAHIYFYTYYYLTNDYLIVRLGFLKVKINYLKIFDIEKLKLGIKLKFKKISMNIYPSNQDVFYAELKSKMKGN